MCDQQRLRPACAYPQSDQSLCLWLEYFMTVKLLTEHHLEFLCLKGGCTGLSESTHVKMPHCWKSHVTANIFLQMFLYSCSQNPWHCASLLSGNFTSTPRGRTNSSGSSTGTAGAITREMIGWRDAWSYTFKSWRYWSRFSAPNT